jgi:hypothetical protein
MSTPFPLFGAFFNCAEDNQPRPFVDMPWPALVEVLSQRHIREEKDGPLFSLARYASPRRLAQNVIELSGIVLDFDEWPEGRTFADLIQKLEGRLFFAYTSHSHLTEGVEKWRIVLPLSAPIPAAKYKAAWQWVVTSLTPFCSDPAPKSPASFFYLPACSKRTAHLARFLVGEGTPIVLPALEGFKRGIPPISLLSTKADWPWLHAKMKAYTRDKEIQKAFRAVLKRKPFGQAPESGRGGNRDQTLLRMTGALAGWAPGVDPEELASVFAPSLEKMAELSPLDPPPDLANATDKLARAQASLLAQSNLRSAAPEILLNTVAPSAEEVFATQANLRGLANENELRQRLFLQHERTSHCWIWRDGDWRGPMTEPAAFRVLPAWWASVPETHLWRVTEKGAVTRRKMDEVFQDHGTLVRKIVADLRLSECTYDAAHDVLRVPGCPLRPLTPERAPSIVEEWLGALGGAKSDKFLDWIATILRLDVASSILFLRMPPGVGKNLIARGLARLWPVDAPTDIVRVAKDFNQELRECPLVQLDEGKWTLWEDPTTQLRKMVTQHARTINEKHLPTYELAGYIRIIITVNNLNIFTQNERQKNALTPEDRDAIAERFLQIECSPDAKKIISSVPTQTRNSWAADNIIARHVLWLAENRAINEGERFIVQGDVGDSIATDIISADKGWGAWVIEWLARYLTEPVVVERAAVGALVWRGDGRVLVNPEAVINSFNAVLPNRANPQSLDISDALRSLSTGDLVSFPEPNPRGTVGFEVLWEDVARWSRVKGIGNPALIRANVQRLRERPPPATVTPIKRMVPNG